MTTIIENKQKYLPLVLAEQLKYGIPDDILVRLIQKESSWRDKNVISIAGAEGIAQFMESTATGPKGYARKIGAEDKDWKDPEVQIKMAGRYLSDMYQSFKKDSNEYVRSHAWELAVAGYNAGEGKVRSALKKAGGTSDWIKHVFDETKDYVSKIIYHGRDQIVSTDPFHTNKKEKSSPSESFFEKLGELDPIFKNVHSLPDKKVKGMAEFLLNIGKGKLVNPF
jgi:Transglycosylase SLT domain